MMPKLLLFCILVTLCIGQDTTPSTPIFPGGFAVTIEDTTPPDKPREFLAGRTATGRTFQWSSYENFNFGPSVGKWNALDVWEETPDGERHSMIMFPLKAKQTTYDDGTRPGAVRNAASQCAFRGETFQGYGSVLGYKTAIVLRTLHTLTDTTHYWVEAGCFPAKTTISVSGVEAQTRSAVSLKYGVSDEEIAVPANLTEMSIQKMNALGRIKRFGEKAASEMIVCGRSGTDTTDPGYEGHKLPRSKRPR